MLQFLSVAIEENVILECINRIFVTYPSIKKVIIDASYNSYALRRSVLFFVSDNFVLENDYPLYYLN